MNGLAGRLGRAALASVLMAALAIVASAAPAAAGCAVTVSGISPAAGFLAGGGTTTITGCGFSQAGTLTVTFGATAATPVTINTDASLSVAAPASTSAGAVTVTVRLHPSAGSDQTATTSYTYVAPPAVSTLVPAKGADKGGTPVVVTGTNLSPIAGSTTSASFGATPATTVSGVSNTGLTAVSPAGTGTVNVTATVTLPGGASATSNGLSYQYVPAPVVTSISPTSGPPTGDQDVTLTGANFQPGAQVLFGPSDGSTSLSGDATATPVSVLSSTQILATTPQGVPGATNVVVLNPDGQSGALEAASAGHYSFTGAAPTINTVAPASGSSLGGTPFTVTGTGFLPAATVAFQATAQANPPTAPAPTVNAAGTQITGTTPAHAAGAVNVVVTNPGGGTVTDTGGYTYNAAAAPTIASLGSITGGTNTSLGGAQLTITGTNFASGAQVTFGGTASPVAAVLGSTSIFVITPAHPGGAVAVAVINPDGQTATDSGAFTYSAAPAPTISSITPLTGPSGTEVTIAGTGFANTVAPGANAISAATVSIGSPACTTSATATCLEPVPPVPPAVASPPVVLSATEIQGVVPDAPGGAVTVTVANPDGRSVTTTFTYTGPSGTPTLASVSPGTGPTLGNTAVTLTGTNFVPGAVVSFGGNDAASGPTAVSANGQTITTTTPAGTYGLVDVTVTNPGGGTVTLHNGFTFTVSPQPMITSVSPSTGPSGTEVTISGTGFANTNGANTNSTAPAEVTVGGQALLPLSGSPSPPVVVSSTTIAGLVPVAPGGAADVAVLNPDGQGAIVVNGYSYPTDTTAPTTTATGLAAGSPYTFGAWAAASVEVTLTASDAGSGVKNISYRATGAQTIPLTVVPVSPPGDSASFTVTGNGVTTVTFYATDIAGNVEAVQTKTVMVDDIKPTVTAAATIPAAGGGTTAYSSGSATDQNVTVSFSCSDNAGGSGVATLTFTSSAGTVTTVSGTNPLSVTVTSVGASQSVTGTCTDVAGNTNSATFSGININRSAPTITASATAGGVAYVAGTWTNQPVTVTFSCTPLSASDQIASLTPPVQVSGPSHNQTVVGTCVDFAGNPSIATFGTASAGIDIDLTLPLATASATTTNNGGQTVPYTAGTWTNHNVKVTFACTDPGPVSSGVATVASPITVTAPGVTSGVVGGCTDVAGNAANPPAFFGPVLIDKTAPSCTAAVNPSPIHPASRQLTAVTATVKVSDAMSGPNGFVLVSVTSNNPATAATDISGFIPGTASTSGKLRATLGRVYTFTYQGFDVAGNASATCTAKVKVAIKG